MATGIEVVGIDVHIGSQLTELEPFEQAFTKVAELTVALRADGHDIRRLDLGGGLGIPYARSNEAPPLPTDYGALIKRTVGDLGCEIEIEPGRLIAGNAGVLVSTVIYVKNGEGRDFLILDAAMNDLVRPSMYGAHHDIVPVIEPAPATPDHAFDVVLAQSGVTHRVAADQSILDCLIEHGCDPLFDCKRGECGVCAVPVIEGDIDHRDYVLSASEKAAGNVIQICISRALGPRLVLDL